jgi:hypothetical protein
MKVLVFGDSHSVVFNLTSELTEVNRSFSGVDINVATIQGSTILGFGKRNSTLNSREVFERKINNFKPDYVCFALGQVDVELGFYYRLVVKGEVISIDQFFEKLINTYFDTIAEIQKTYQFTDNQICIKGINLPVLVNSRAKAIEYTSKIITENMTDDLQIIEMNKKLSKLLPSSLERSSFHQRFNSKVMGRATGKYSYFDINDVLEDSDNLGYVKKVFIPARKDHHVLDSLFVREVVIEKMIREIIKNQ